MISLSPGSAEATTGRLEAESGTDLPTWNGELYLEYHRGTYTTQARTKRNNRKSEFLLHDAEFLAAWAALATEFTWKASAARASGRRWTWRLCPTRCWRAAR